MMAVFTVTILSSSSLSTQAYTNEESKTHYSYLASEDKDYTDVGDVFYRNNGYFRCEAKNLCPKIEDPEQETKKFVYFLGQEDGLVVPVTMNCYRDGSAGVQTAENLVPLLNEEVLNNSDCFDESSANGSVPNYFLEDTLEAI